MRPQKMEAIALEVQKKKNLQNIILKNYIHL